MRHRSGLRQPNSGEISSKVGVQIAGMIFKHALAHEADVKVVSCGKILKIWKVSLKKKHTEEKSVIG